jgi:hypothetical protein
MAVITAAAWITAVARHTGHTIDKDSAMWIYVTFTDPQATQALQAVSLWQMTSW